MKVMACFITVSLLLALAAPIGLSEMSGIGLSVNEWNDYLDALLEARKVDVDIIPMDKEYDDPIFEVKLAFSDGYVYSAFMLIPFNGEGIVSTAYFTCEFYDTERSNYDDPINIIWTTAMYIAGMYNNEDADARDRMFAGVHCFLEDMRMGRGADKVTIENDNHSFSLSYRKVQEDGYPDFLVIAID
jgi:hypothetical protein